MPAPSSLKSRRNDERSQQAPRAGAQARRKVEGKQGPRKHLVRRGGKDLPGWVHEGLRGVEEKTSPGSLPVFVVLREGAPKSEAIAVVRLSELARVFKIGPAGELKDEGEKA